MKCCCSDVKPQQANTLLAYDTVLVHNLSFTFLYLSPMNNLTLNNYDCSLFCWKLINLESKIIVKTIHPIKSVIRVISVTMTLLIHSKTCNTHAYHRWLGNADGDLIGFIYNFRTWKDVVDDDMQIWQFNGEISMYQENGTNKFDLESTVYNFSKCIWIFVLLFQNVLYH